jgi:hypothetical protein
MAGSLSFSIVIAGFGDTLTSLGRGELRYSHLKPSAEKEHSRERCRHGLARTIGMTMEWRSEMPMISECNEYGIIGIGRRGGNLARHALEMGVRVVSYTRPPAPPATAVVAATSETN